MNKMTDNGRQMELTPTYNSVLLVSCNFDKHATSEHAISEDPIFYNRYMQRLLLDHASIQMRKRAPNDTVTG